MYKDGYATARFNWQDNSRATTNVLFTPSTDGLCVPFGFILAERGVPGEIKFGGSAQLQPYFGAETFDSSSVFYNSATSFHQAAMGGQGVELMRVVDPAAETATVGLFLEISDVAVPQYQKAVDGTRLIDEDGEFIPELDENDAPVTAPGISANWVHRVLASNEIFDALTVTTVTNGGTTKTVYPIIAGVVASPGSYGDRQGFRLFSTGTEMAEVANDVKSTIYRFQPMELPRAASTNATYIADLYGSSYVDISFKNKAVFSGTETNYAFKYVMGTNYIDENGDSTLPYTLALYGDNIAAAGARLIALTEDLEGTDPYAIDLISGRDSAGLYYDNLLVTDASAAVVSSSAIVYASGGTDGDTSWAKYDELVADWLAGNDHGTFGNMSAHPMTHFYDPGFSMDTKYLVYNMLDLRDNLVLDMSTQDIARAPNTAAQDMSAGQALLTRALMHPESTINGVGCCRVNIYAHCGKLASGSAYEDNIPFTYNRLIQRRNLAGGSSVTGSAGGFPNSQVTEFRKPQWVADDDTVRKNAWADAINVVSHADRTSLFYADLRSTYPNDTSLLVTSEVVDNIVYMFKICRAVWATFSGVRQPAPKLYPRIEKLIRDKCTLAFSGDSMTFTPRVYQTAADNNLGYRISIDMNVSGDPSIRQMNFNVIVARNVTPGTESTSA